MRQEVLRIENGKKREGDITALKDIYLQLFKGESFGIIFQNMQEKECFLEIMRGEKCMDEGFFYLREELLEQGIFCKDVKGKVSVIGRGETLFAEMTVAENIYFMDIQRRGRLVNLYAYEEKANALLQKYSIQVAASALAKKLTLAQRVEVEVVSAMIQGKDLLVLEDVIVLLKEKGKLWKLLKEYIDGGGTLLFVESLNLDILEYVDRISIVDKGIVNGIYEKDDITEEKLLDMLDRRRKGKRPTVEEKGDEILSFDQVQVENLRPIQFCIGRGDILFLLCDDVQVFETIDHLFQGRLEISGGSMYYRGKRIYAETFRHYQGKKIGMIREIPTKTMLFSNLRVLDNLCLPFSQKIFGFWRKRRLRESIKNELEGFLDQDCYEQKINDLPHEERLKIAYLRWYLYKPEILICVRPFESGDLQMTHIAQEIMEMFAEKKISVIILSLTMKNVILRNYQVCYIDRKSEELE